MSRLGNEIRKTRIEKNIPQSKFAKFLGYSNGQLVSNFERGRAPVPTKQLKKISKRLNISKNRIKKLMLDDYRDYLASLLK